MTHGQVHLLAVRVGRCLSFFVLLVLLMQALCTHCVWGRQARGVLPAEADLRTVALTEQFSFNNDKNKSGYLISPSSQVLEQQHFGSEKHLRVTALSTFVIFLFSKWGVDEHKTSGQLGILQSLETPKTSRSTIRLVEAAPSRSSVATRICWKSPATICAHQRGFEKSVSIIESYRDFFFRIACLSTVLYGDPFRNVYSSSVAPQSWRSSHERSVWNIGDMFCTACAMLLQESFHASKISKP